MKQLRHFIKSDKYSNNKAINKICTRCGKAFYAPEYQEGDFTMCRTCTLDAINKGEYE